MKHDTLDVRFSVREETWTARFIFPISAVNTREAFGTVIDIYDGVNDWMERLENTPNADLIIENVIRGDVDHAIGLLEMTYNEESEEAKAYKDRQREVERKQVEATYKYNPFNPDGSRKE